MAVEQHDEEKVNVVLGEWLLFFFFLGAVRTCQ